MVKSCNSSIHLLSVSERLRPTLAFSPTVAHRDGSFPKGATVNPVVNPGEQFGWWTIIRFVGRNHKSQQLYLCVCRCGEKRQVRGYNLFGGISKSCGCLNRQVARARRLTHGQSASTEYHAWRAMKARCTNRNLRSFKDYGGRGIKVCARWVRSFENFLSDMGLKPSPELSIERV